MGSFLVYTIYSGLVLLILYLLYRLFLSSEKQIVFNRCVLLLSYLIAFIWWPLSRFDWSLGSPVAIDHPMVEFGELAMTGIAVSEETASVWPRIVLSIYLVGAAVVFAWTIFSIFRLLLYIKSGEMIDKGEYTLVVMHGSSVAPFSFGRYVVMSEADCKSVGVTVTAHELAHIRCRHYLDLILAQIVCVVMWYNPAAWLMRDELALIHEYQADAAVIYGGADPRSYQMLLIRKTVGNRFHTLANSLNHSKLKNRIAMMQKEKSGAMRRMRVLALALAPVLAVALTNIPAIASGLKSIENVSFNQHSDASSLIAETSVDFEPAVASVAEAVVIGEDLPMESVESETSAMRSDEKNQDNVVSAPEEVAMFPGGVDEMMRYLAFNIRYPQKAHDENRQGRSIVQFDVEADGSISNVRIVKSAGEDLDEEAIRVVKKMPKWTPAKQNGKNVASEFTLPVNFRLSPASEQDEKEMANSANSFDEIQVVGYGAIKKDVSGASVEPKTVRLTTDTPNPPTIFVDGELYQGDFVDLNPKTIESITVDKDTPEYPNGVIRIKLKK